MIRRRRRDPVEPDAGRQREAAGAASARRRRGAPSARARRRGRAPRPAAGRCTADLVAEERDRLAEPEVAKVAPPKEPHPTTVSGLIVPSVCRCRPRRARRRRPRGRSGPSPPLERPAGRARAPPPRRRGAAPAGGRARRAAAARAPASASSTRNGPDRRAPEPAAVAAERVGDRPDVRPARDVELELDQRRLVADDPSEWIGRAAHRHLDGDAAPVEPVGALAVDLDRGGGRNGQLDLALERERSRARCAIVVSSIDLPFRVAGRRAQPEPDLGLVALVQPDEVAREPGRRARGGRAAGRSRADRACRRALPSARSAGAGRRRPRTTTARPACRPGRGPMSRAPATATPV